MGNVSQCVGKIKTQKQLHRKGGLLCKLGVLTYFSIHLIFQETLKRPLDLKRRGLGSCLVSIWSWAVHITSKFSSLSECALDNCFQLKNVNILWLAVIIIRQVPDSVHRHEHWILELEDFDHVVQLHLWKRKLRFAPLSPDSCLVFFIIHSHVMHK